MKTIKDKLTSLITIKVAKPAILSIFSRISSGSLVVLDEVAGTKHIFNHNNSNFDNTEPSDEQDTDCNISPTLVVKDIKFWMRLMFFSGIGFADSYLGCEVDCDDLLSFFKVY